MNAKESIKYNVSEMYNIIQLKFLNLLRNFALTGSQDMKRFCAPLTKKAKKSIYPRL